VLRVDAGEFPFANVRASLAKAVSADRAHFYTLGLLDGELESELRSDLAADLDGLLENPHVVERIEAMLRSAPLPPDADVRAAIDLASSRGAARVVSLLIRLDSDAPLIDRVHAAWTDFASTLKSNSEAQSARQWFATSGGFSRLVESLRQNSREPFAAWMLGTGREAPREFGPVPLKALQHLQNVVGLPIWPAPAAAHEYVREREEEPDEEPSRRRRESRRSRLSRAEVFARVNTQIDEIRRRLESGDEETTERYLDDLIEFQRQNGSTAEQIAKSLCNIAAHGHAIGRLDFAERCLRRALVERPDDGWAHSQLSAVLRAGGRFDEAGDAAKLAEAYRPDSVGLKAAAEALRAQSRYVEALQKYDESLERFPNDVGAQNGRAEVLKALGRYDEALVSYAAAIEQFPNDVFPQTGRAEVLKSLGRYDEALASYAAAVEQFPNDVVAQTGRAEVLKALGRYDEALASYAATIEQFPNDVVAQTGRAEVLKALGRYDEALADYETTIERFQNEAVARNGRAEVLKALGRYDEALAGYEATIERFPNDVFARNGRAEVLKALGRYDEALADYETTIERFPNNVVAHCGRAGVLKALGRNHEALASYEATIELFPRNAVARDGRASVLLLAGRFDEALQALPLLEPRVADDWIAWHIRGMILVRLGEFGQAEMIFRRGVSEAPSTSRDYFRTALAALQLRQRRFRDVIRDLEPVVAGMPAERRTAATVLLAHASAAVHETLAAERWLDETAATRVPVVVDLRAALAERYALRIDRPTAVPTRPHEELDRLIDDREFRLLTLAHAA
jgi:tetratricopeptide (TPR) repeat protein